MPEDVYELKCQPTNDNVKKQVLVPYKTGNGTYSDLTFEKLMDNYLFQIVLAVFVLYILYNMGRYVINYIKPRNVTLPLRGGFKRR
jgi:hypothetical protein